MRGSKETPWGTASRMRWRYSMACCAVVAGGLKMGMMMARANCAAVWGTTSRMAAPSRTCKCQSSGRVSVMLWIWGLMPRLSENIHEGPWWLRVQ